MNWKNFFIRLAGAPPAALLGRAVSRHRPLVVLYHGVSAHAAWDGSENYRGKHVPAAAFQRELEWLARRFEIVPLAEIERLAASGAAPKRPICAITFDDGYRNNYRNAFPILKAMKLPATIFVTTGFIDRREPLWPDRLEYAINKSRVDVLVVSWPEGERRYPVKTVGEKIIVDQEIRERLKRFPDSERIAILDALVQASGAELSEALEREEDYCPLTWEEVREMTGAGITIGAHTVNHPILSRLAAGEQAKEIRESAERIRAVAGSCRHFAYPNGQPGDWNEITEKAVAAAGFGAAWTTVARRVRPGGERNLFALPRLALDHGWQNRRFEALTSNVLPGLRAALGRLRPKSKKEFACVLLLATILGLGIFLRFDGLAEKGFYIHDEAQNALAAKTMARAVVNVVSFSNAATDRLSQMSWGVTYTAARPGFIYPVAVWMLAVGDAPWASMAFSALFGSATILLLYFFTKRLFGAAAALAAAALLAVMPYHVLYSRMGLTQVTTGFFFLLAAYLYVRTLEAGRTGNFKALLGTGLCFGYLLSLHHSMVVPLAGFFLVDAGFFVRRPLDSVRDHRWGKLHRYFRRLALFAAGFAIPIVFWQGVTLARAWLIARFGVPNHAMSYFEEFAGIFPASGGKSLADYLFRHPGYYLNTFLDLNGAVIALLVAAGLILVFALRRFRADRRLLAVSLLVLWTAAVYTVIPLKVPRNYVPLLPFLALFAGAAAAALLRLISRPRLRLALAVVLALLVAVSVAPKLREIIALESPYARVAEFLKPDASRQVRSAAWPAYQYLLERRVLMVGEGKQESNEFFVSDWQELTPEASDAYCRDRLPLFRAANPIAEFRPINEDTGGVHSRNEVVVYGASGCGAP